MIENYKELDGYMHGDLALIKVDALPNGLQPSKSKEIMRGNSNNPHLIDQGELYFINVDRYIFGYLIAKNTILLHVNHGDIIKGEKIREAKIPNGIYELHHQYEDTPKGLEIIQD